MSDLMFLKSQLVDLAQLGEFQSCQNSTNGLSFGSIVKTDTKTIASASFMEPSSSKLIFVVSDFASLQIVSDAQIRLNFAI
jgi:hypothetical protein